MKQGEPDEPVVTPKRLPPIAEQAEDETQIPRDIEDHFEQRHAIGIELELILEHIFGTVDDDAGCRGGEQDEQTGVSDAENERTRRRRRYFDSATAAGHLMLVDHNEALPPTAARNRGNGQKQITPRSVGAHTLRMPAIAFLGVIFRQGLRSQGRPDEPASPGVQWRMILRDAKLRVRRNSGWSPWAVMMGVVYVGLTGGCSEKPPAEPGRAMRWVSVRLADAKDLQVRVESALHGPHGFPNVTTEIVNHSADPLLIAFTPYAITVHCGEYQQRGPGGRFVCRREVIAAGEPRPFSQPVGNWSKVDSNGDPELLVPVELPPGRYELWVTVDVIGEKEMMLSSERTPYVHNGNAP